MVTGTRVSAIEGGAKKRIVARAGALAYFFIQRTHEPALRVSVPLLHGVRHPWGLETDERVYIPRCGMILAPGMKCPDTKEV